MKGAVIVRFDEDGELSYHAFGDVRLFIVDERCPHDRVYEYLDRPPIKQFRELIPEGSEIGSCLDERHEAIANAVLAKLRGEERFKLVPKE